MDAKHASIYKRYSDHLLIKGFAKSTVVVYSKEAKELLEYVDDIEHITTQIAIKYMGKYSHLSKASRNFHVVAIKALTTYLRKNIYLKIDEINIPHIKIGRKLPEILDQKIFIEKINMLRDEASLCNWMYKRDYALIILIYATGMRVSEALNFELSDINENDWVRIEKGKGSKDRYVPIAESAIDAIKDYRDNCPFSLSKSFFLNYLGTAITRFTVFNIVKKKMGMNPHSLRHHFATHMARGDATIGRIVARAPFPSRTDQRGRQIGRCYVQGR